MEEERPSEEQNEQQYNDRIKIILEDNDGNRVEYRVRKTVPLGKLAEAYAKKFEKSTEHMRLSWLGRQVQKSDTPESLDLPDEARIELMVPSDGGFQ